MQMGRAVHSVYIEDYVVEKAIFPNKLTPFLKGTMKTEF